MDEKQNRQIPTRRVRAVPVNTGYAAGPRGTGPAPERDIFPYLMGGLVSAGVLGLLLIGWLLLARPAGPTVALLATPTPFAGLLEDYPTANVPAAQGTALPYEVPTTDLALPAAVPTGSPPPEGDPPRMQLGDFKRLYDNPATRPIIIDTRNQQTFDEGHIPGAILFPPGDVAKNVASLPKDKLIVAYCQWPAEHSSASVARELKEKYGYSYDYVQVLLGGWDAWLTKFVQDPNGYPVAYGNK